jgi:5'/3'-nucleotidase SurE
MNNDVRFATFNVSLNRNTGGELITDLSTPSNSQAQAVAEIIQRNNPDVILLNEFDYDAAGKAIKLFQDNYLGVSQNGAATVEYPYVYLAPSNTGIPSGFDLDKDGITNGAGDAYGFGFFPGQFGMVLLSKYPIDTENARTFQDFLWKDMPGALLPDDTTTPESNDYYSEEELEVLRLSSKSHWDIPVEINGETVHIIASHPTPPVFDGEEDRNGRRNHDEIRFWSDYITPGSNSYIYDDAGNYGGLADGSKFVILGDQNADPFDGDSTDNAILQLLGNYLINSAVTPSSEGGIDASIRTNDINDTHLGNPAFDTGDFNDESPGNLRVDYVLPSNNLEVTDAGVFWTTADDHLFRLIGDFDPDSEIPNGFPASDHRLVYVDANSETVTPALDILLVNDDGFEAEGINVLYEALVAAGHNVTLVAPKEQQSGKGTLINVDSVFQPTEIVEFAENKWYVDGSPVVTTLAGLDYILEGDEPDLVISGINEGANVGENIVISSGTVGAATTATRRGIPAIAVSGEGDEETIAETYETGTEFVLDVIEELAATQAPGEELLAEGVGLNVNIPDNYAGGVALTELDETSNIDLSFGELPEGFGDGAGVLFNVNDPISPDQISNFTSEGQNFLAGNITLTPIDGSWVANDSVREAIQSRATAEIETTETTPLDILLTNDDGFEAEGIETIYNALTAAGHNVTLVAPEEQQSGTGTALDVDAILQPTEVVNYEENKWYVDAGVRTTTWAGLDYILEETPDLVISGINEGENIGAGGAVSSGTVSAAVTAILRDVPAIAVSGGIDLNDPEMASTSVAYEEGSEYITQLIAQLQATQGDEETILPEGTGLSVNIPARFPEGVEGIQGVAFTEPDEIEPFIIDFGEVEGGAGLRFAPFELTENTEIDPLSEGGQFLSGFITVTALDGDWTADSQQVSATGDRLDSLLFTPENTAIKRVTNLDFLGEVMFPTGFTFAETEVGGISGLTYDAANEVYYALSDDRSTINDARFYSVGIDLNDGSLDDGDVEFQDVTTLLNVSSEAFTSSSLDPEGIALTNEGTVYISSEGEADNLVDPFIAEFSLDGQILNELTIPDKFLPTANQSRGIRNNQAFESLTITPNQRYLFTATENALFQDGEVSSVDTGSLVRISQYDLETREVIGEFLYETDAIPVTPDPADGFADNGLVELLAIDNTGTLLALERSFAEGVGNNIRLYQVSLQGATNVSNAESLLNEAGEITEVDAIARKELLLDFNDLGITLDNSESLSFGETLPDGRQTLIVTSDNNFNEEQSTQFLAFALDTETIPTVTPVTQTPSEIRFGDPNNPDLTQEPDADDPAIYVNSDNPEASFVIATFKNDGLRVYDLAGNELQSITPENIRYNNVDLAYDVSYTNMLGEESQVDLAIASDRANDTLAIYAINPDTRQLTDVTAFNIPESIFGVDDGEATAYGLTTYTSVIDGKNYVFVSQADGNKVAQLEITAQLGAADALEVNAEVIEIIDVPVPEAEDAEEYQVEGMVVDREQGYLYVGQEGYGIWKYDAEPNNDNAPILVDKVENGNLAADVEGLTMYYGEEGDGYLLASSQGDNTFAIYDRTENNSYLDSFAVEGVEGSDGADIVSVPLGDDYPAGLLVVHDGSNTPEAVFPDPEDGELQNFNTNFKYVSVADLFETLPN